MQEQDNSELNSFCASQIEITTAKHTNKLIQGDKKVEGFALATEISAAFLVKHLAFA